MRRSGALLGVVAALTMAAGCLHAPGVLTSCPATPRGPVGLDAADVEDEPDYDPWQDFNERMFVFNHQVLDRWVIRPAAEGWAYVVPEAARRGIGRLLDNLEMPRRFTNKVLQARPLDAARELARFTVNAVAGLGGLVDVASRVHLPASDADGGQTLAMVGFGTGPYLVLPSFPPMTVRDGIGRGIDAALNPISYFLPFFVYPSHSVASAINQRSLNLRLFADAEDGTLDLYSAARNAHLQRRRRVVYGAVAARDCQWAWARETDE